MLSRARTKRSGSLVFLNCPFDLQYRPLMRSACFAILACGYEPCCALDVSDSGTVRFATIVRMIANADLSIHDISRVELDDASGLPRFNMPHGPDLRDILVISTTGERHTRAWRQHDLVLGPPFGGNKIAAVDHR